MRRALAAFVTVLLMGLLLGLGMRSPMTPAPTAKGPASQYQPEDEATQVVERVLASARDGDLAAYLSAFTGEVRDRLDRDVASKGREEFIEELRQAARTRKGHAVFAPEPDGPDATSIAVESVYPEHNERQTFRLERSVGAWRVTDVATARTLVPAAKYGSPASYVAPEGPPVP